MANMPVANIVAAIFLTVLTLFSKAENFSTLGKFNMYFLLMDWE